MTVGKTCRIGNQDIELCHGMNEVLESEGRGTKYQGVKLMTLVNMKTMDFSRHLIIVKSGKHAKRGLTFNFCPFCRAELIAGCEEEWSRVATSSDGSSRDPALSPTPAERGGEA